MYGSWLGNMIGLLYFLLFQCCGMLIALALFKRESLCVKLLLGSVMGNVMLQWLPVAFAFFLDFNLLSHLLSLAVILAVSVLLLVKMLREQRLSLGRIKAAGETVLMTVYRHQFAVVILAVLVLYVFLVVGGLVIKDGRVYSSQGTFGDMSMHLGFITSIAEQGSFPPHYSILPQELLSYPFLSDSISSSIYLFGSSLKLAYTLPMVFAGAQVLFGFYMLAYNLLKDKLRAKLKAALAFVMFFFCGGAGIVYFLGGEEGNFTRIFKAFYETPTNYVEENIRWVNVVVDMMLPQRSTLFGWAVIIAVMYLLYRAVFDDMERYFLPAAVLTGLLPMIHTHSFLFAAMFCVMMVIVYIVRGKMIAEIYSRVLKWVSLGGLLVLAVASHYIFALNKRESPAMLYIGLAGAGLAVLFMLVLVAVYIIKGNFAKLLRTWGVFLGVVLVLALPQLLLWTFQQSSDFVKPYFNWANISDSYVVFYLKNIGLTGFLAISALLFAKNKTMLIVSPALLSWYVAEFVQFQPNVYDNNKLLYPAFMLVCCITADFAVDIIYKIRAKGARTVLATVFTAAISISAVLTMGREVASEYEIFGTGATELTEYIIAEVPPESTFMTSTRHNNEIAALSGRNIVCGSPSYLYFHGLDYYVEKDDVDKFYENPLGSLEVLEKYSVDYILVSDFERNDFNLDEKSIEDNFPKVYENGSIKLFSTKLMGQESE